MGNGSREKNELVRLVLELKGAPLRDGSMGLKAQIHDIRAKGVQVIRRDSKSPEVLVMFMTMLTAKYRAIEKH